jgi:hypothetical protein
MVPHSSPNGSGGVALIIMAQYHYFLGISLYGFPTDSFVSWTAIQRINQSTQCQTPHSTRLTHIVP